MHCNTLLDIMDKNALSKIMDYSALKENEL
jgi:hypothetical protein